MIAQIDFDMIRQRPLKIPGRLISYALIEGRPLTTAGQWINPLVFAGYRAAQVLPSPRKARAPIFIVGTGRSGTTILGKLFTMHRQAAFLNEPKALWHYAHGAEDIIGSYGMGPAQIRLEAPSDPAAMARKIARVYGWALTWAGSTRIVDKYPELIFRADFIQSLFPDAKMVAIVRDGVDTCASVTHWSRRKGEERAGEQHDWWGRNGRKWSMIVEQLVPEHPDLAPLQAMLRETQDHRDRAAVEWIVSMREVERAMAQTPGLVHKIRYEDMCADPDAVLGEMIAFCDLPKDETFLDYSRQVLSKAEQPGTLELHPDLVEPFKKALDQLGYSSSQDRVTTRAATLSGAY